MMLQSLWFYLAIWFVLAYSMQDIKNRYTATSYQPPSESGPFNDLCQSKDKYKEYNASPTVCRSQCRKGKRGFDKFIWFMVDALPIDNAEPTIKMFGSKANTYRVFNIADPMSNAIYDSYVTGHLANNIMGEKIHSDNLVTKWQRNKKKVKYVGDTLSVLQLYAPEDFYGGTVHIEDKKVLFEWLFGDGSKGEPTQAQVDARLDLLLEDPAGMSLFIKTELFDGSSHKAIENNLPQAPVRALADNYAQHMRLVVDWVNRHPEYVLLITSDHGKTQDIVRLHGARDGGNEPFLSVYSPELVPSATQRPWIDTVDVCATMSQYFNNVEFPYESMGMAKPCTDDPGYALDLAQRNAVQIYELAKHMGLSASLPNLREASVQDLYTFIKTIKEPLVNLKRWAIPQIILVLTCMSLLILGHRRAFYQSLSTLLRTGHSSNDLSLSPLPLSPGNGQSNVGWRAQLSLLSQGDLLLACTALIPSFYFVWEILWIHWHAEDEFHNHVWILQMALLTLCVYLHLSIDKKHARGFLVCLLLNWGMYMARNTLLFHDYINVNKWLRMTEVNVLCLALFTRYFIRLTQNSNSSSSSSSSSGGGGDVWSLWDVKTAGKLEQGYLALCVMSYMYLVTESHYFGAPVVTFCLLHLVHLVVSGDPKASWPFMPLPATCLLFTLQQYESEREYLLLFVTAQFLYISRPFPATFANDGIGERERDGRNGAIIPPSSSSSSSSSMIHPALVTTITTLTVLGQAWSAFFQAAGGTLDTMAFVSIAKRLVELDVFPGVGLFIMGCHKIGYLILGVCYALRLVHRCSPGVHRGVFAYLAAKCCWSVVWWHYTFITSHLYDRQTYWIFFTVQVAMFYGAAVLAAQAWQMWRRLKGKGVADDGDQQHQQQQQQQQQQ